MINRTFSWVDALAGPPGTAKTFPSSRSYLIRTREKEDEMWKGNQYLDDSFK